MPIYEYQCTQCQSVEEVIQKFSDKPLRKCKKCSGKLQKLVSQSSFHLKGTGWYVTDYANKTRNAGASAKSSDSPSSDDKSSNASDSGKPEKTTDKTRKKS